jgi:hypothetical protein
MVRDDGEGFSVTDGVRSGCGRYRHPESHQ